MRAQRTSSGTGANRVVAGNPGTFDEYMKSHIPRQTANYVAVVLERSGVVELSDQQGRVHLRLTPGI